MKLITLANNAANLPINIILLVYYARKLADEAISMKKINNCILDDNQYKI